MRRASFYSNSPRSRSIPRAESPGPEKPVEAPARRRWRDLYTQYERNLLLGALVLLALLTLSSHLAGTPERSAVSQQEIDAAVARALAEQPLPSPAAKVYDAVRGAIVRVRALGDALETGEQPQRSVGSGVVIVDRGTILTSLHVVSGAGRLRVVGGEAGATDEFI